MSGWDAYITNTQGRVRDQAVEVAIVGWESGVSVWAKSEGWTISNEEAKVFTLSEGDIRARGARIAGRKFLLLRCEEDDKGCCVMQLKSARDDDGKTVNATVYRTKKVLVFTVGKSDGVVGPEVSKACSWCGDYLLQSGY